MHTLHALCCAACTTEVVYTVINCTICLAIDSVWHVVELRNAVGKTSLVGGLLPINHCLLAQATVFNYLLLEMTCTPLPGLLKKWEILPLPMFGMVD